MRFKILGSLALAAALTLGLASPAAAQTKTFKDKAGDAVKSSAAGVTGKAAAPDITAVKIAYKKSGATITVRFAKLTKKNLTNLNVDFDINKDGFYDLSLHGFFTPKKVEAELTGGWGLTVTQKPGAPITMKPKYGDKGSVTVSVPAVYLLSGDALTNRLGVAVEAFKFPKGNTIGSLGTDRAPAGFTMSKHAWMKVKLG